MPIFRREFAVTHQPLRATLRLVGLGQWSASLDGKSLLPGAGLHGSWTNYGKRVAFRSLDVTGLLRPGVHALGVMLGNGMYNVQKTSGRYTKFEGSFGAPKLTAELRLLYPKGRTEVIATDATWQVARGPVVFSSTFGGEDFDARRVQTGWERAGFRGEGWVPASLVDGPGGRVEEAIEPDVRGAGRYRVIQQREPVPGKVVLDLGQNFAGVPHVRVQGPRGAVLKLTPCELLNADGTVSQASSGRGMWWSYTLRGGAEEDWRPQFSYYGFRYVQAEWMQPGVERSGPAAGAAPRLLELVGEPLHSDSPASGTFRTSNQMLNRIHELIVRAMHHNEVSVLTDCPHREKLGWLEQTHLMASGLLFNDDLELLYRETARNMAEAQDAGGRVPTIAPQYTKFGPRYAVYDDSPEWGSAVVLAPWAAYSFYGDKRELERSYPAMQAWVRYLEQRAADGIVTYGLGDWYDIGAGDPGFSKNTSAGVTGTLMLLHCAQAMQRIAELLGRAADAERYRDLAVREAAAFHRRFWDPEHRWYDHGSQTANAMPLALGIVPAELQSVVLDRVIDDIHAHSDHVTAGEIGYPYLLRALAAAGRNDVVMAMLMRKDSPSYGAQLQAGVTALTEAWDANPKSSQDHFMLGGAEEWFYRALGGIDVDLSRANTAERIRVKPDLVPSVEWVQCGYVSRLGRISSHWQIQGAITRFDVTVPVEATIVLPLRSGSAMVHLAGRRNVEHVPGVRVLGRDAVSANFRVSPGSYHFIVHEARL